MKYKNVLEVINLFGSASNFIGDQFSFLREKGYNMHLICSFDEKLPEFAQKQGINYKSVVLKRTLSPINDIKAYFEICKYIKQYQIDTIIAHQFKARLIAMFAAFTMNVPNRIIFAHGVLYETMHGVKRHIFMIVDRIVASLSHKVVCVSPSVANVRVKDRINKPEKNYILNKGTCGGIDTVNLFNPELYSITEVDKIKKSLGLDDDNFIIGFCGRLVKDKGIIELIEAFELLCKAHSQKKIKLLIIGPKEIRDSIPEETIDKIMNNLNIVFTGYIDHYKIPIYYKLMDILVLPSYREGFGMVTIEAAAMQVPSIVSKSTGCIDSIKENITGIYTKIDSLDIKKNIELYFDRNFRNKLAVNCRQFVVDNFDHKKVWPFIIDVIEK